MDKNLSANAGDMSLIPGLGRSHMLHHELQLLKPVSAESVIASSGGDVQQRIAAHLD